MLLPQYSSVVGRSDAFLLPGVTPNEFETSRISVLPPERDASLLFFFSHGIYTPAFEILCGSSTSRCVGALLQAQVDGKGRQVDENRFLLASVRARWTGARSIVELQYLELRIKKVTTDSLDRTFD